jgi:hypothetical protein
MIARLWRGRAGSAANGDAYQRHVMGQVFPALRKVSEHRGGQVPPEARAVLAEFDDFVRHYEVQE